MLIDPKSPMPVYQQIATQLRRRISKGIYQSGESLPSLRVLAVELGVNPNTIQRAYEELAREGIVESRRGAGLFVTASEPAATGRAELRLEHSLDRTIQRALTDGISPERIRVMFREAMHNRLEKSMKGDA